MNEVIKAISQRYSCRAFTSEMPAEEQLRAIAGAAAAAPSAMNRQPWRVIVVKNQELIKEMDEEGMRFLANLPDKTAYDRIMGRGGKLFYGAPCLIMVPIEAADYAAAARDCGIVCQNIALAATSLGLGNLICGMARMPLEGSRGAEFKARMGFPEGFVFGCAVLIGQVAAPGTPHQPDQTKITFVE